MDQKRLAWNYSEAIQFLRHNLIIPAKGWQGAVYIQCNLIVQPVRMSTPNVTEVRSVELLQAPFAAGLMMVSHKLRSLLRNSFIL